MCLKMEMDHVHRPFFFAFTCSDSKDGASSRKTDFIYFFLENRATNSSKQVTVLHGARGWLRRKGNGSLHPRCLLNSWVS